jgi:Tol biopolymer transport system component
VHTRASWAPDGRTIAFRGEFNGVGGISLVDSSGANRRLLLAGEGVGFTWSPDSRWLAFSAVGSLYKIRVNGDSLTQLTSSTGDIRPAWSPDGTQIAFVRTGVWLLRMDSLTTRQLSTSGNFPSWHPNGMEVVVMDAGQQMSDLQFLYGVDAMNTATGEWRTLYSFKSPDNCAFGSMSPAGDRYLFRAQPNQGLSQVWGVDLATMTPTRLTADGADYPAWSPGGVMIVYTRTAEGDGALWLMRSDGSGRRRLTSL